MESVSFEVGAKAARLIGRENIANVDGALVELIKNSYDADASCVCVYFDMPFPFVPLEISFEMAKRVFSSDEMDSLKEYYVKSNGEYRQKEFLSDELRIELKRFIAKFNRIIIADNGHGMSLNDVKTKWMYIGTSDKEINKESPKGRVKTGAKGIGRFALDKLSEKSTMITQREHESTICWELNWEQFENTLLLSQVSADMYEKDKSYEDIVKDLLEVKFSKQFTDYRWDSGTLLILTPIREDWSTRLFEKVNNNLKSINPLGTADPFRVFVKNRYYPKMNFETSEVAISKDDYDYKISMTFDGEKNLKVLLTRNEVDINKKTVLLKKYNRRVDLNSFWNRPYFSREKNKRLDYASEIDFKIDVTKSSEDNPEKIKNVGPFDAELYFGKSVKSSEEIIKRIVAKDRKRLYGTFAGIKIYRDSFKVRPYGDDGIYLDWLGLGRRQDLSPGGVGDTKHDWRVLPYQLIGQVKISRDKNPGLYDMANREGLTQNDEYNIFCGIILKAIEIFEIDRRGFYREYNNWKSDIEKTFGVDANIKADAISAINKKDKANSENPVSKYENPYSKYTEHEYQETVYNLIKENESMLNAQQILQMLSSSGLILNTFFHEFKAFESQFGARAPQLRLRIKHMIEKKDLYPNKIYDPFIIIDKMQETDAMLAYWLELAMDKIERPNLELRKADLLIELKQALERWKNLLNSKNIHLDNKSDDTLEYEYDFSEIDLYIILNNFMLNSVYFLEKEKNVHRLIEISLTKSEDYYNLKLWNNGPELDEKYKPIPDKVFELGESTKVYKNGSLGTGVGLWITKATVERYGGSIAILERDGGFGLDIYLKR